MQPPSYGVRIIQQQHPSFENHHECTERCRVFSELLSGIECEECQVATWGAGKNAGGDAAGGGVMSE